MTGMIWSSTRSGQLWHNDPKEIFALLTWLLYFVLTLYRSTASWRGRRAAWLGRGRICTRALYVFGSTASRRLSRFRGDLVNRCPFFSSESITKQLRWRSASGSRSTMRRVPNGLRRLVDGEIVREGLIVSTCNRVEILSATSSDQTRVWRRTTQTLSRHFRPLARRFSRQASLSPHK